VVADIGIVIQPDTVRAQIEGGVLFGISNALYEKITIKGGVPKHTNFHEYKIMKMSEAPQVSVNLVSSTNPPTGIGEAGTVVVPAALANAFAALTGKRLRHMPFTEERVKGAML
jgi:isoquinoline 1-oxidoreductase beta subunit